MGKSPLTMGKNAVSREIVSADMHAPARDHAHLILRATDFPDSRLVNGLGEYRELVRQSHTILHGTWQP